MMKLAAIIILYHPKKEVLQNIATYIDRVDKLFVFDNTETNYAASFFSHLTNAEYLHDGQNRGISERLNAGCKKAISEGYDWILTMDQDTRFSEHSISYYLNCFDGYTQKDATAVIGTRYHWEEKPSSPICQIEDSVDAITSGMLLNLAIWQKTGGFDEALFIDSVDTEYCLRASTRGYKIILFANVYILHEIGTHVYNASVKSLYTIRKKKVVHSAIRCYYMYRNMLYLERYYQNTFPNFCYYLRKTVENHVRVCFYYNKQMFATYFYLKLAKKDFKKGRMGKVKSYRLLK